MKWMQVKKVGNTLVSVDSGKTLEWTPTTRNKPRSYFWRPVDAPGTYSQVNVEGGMACYNPLGDDPQVFGFINEVPNAPGMSAITEVPLP